MILEKAAFACQSEKGVKGNFQNPWESSINGEIIYKWKTFTTAAILPRMDISVDVPQGQTMRAPPKLLQASVSRLSCNVSDRTIRKRLNK